MTQEEFAKLDFTVVGGPCHGVRIPPSNGLKPLLFATRPARPYQQMEAIEHVSHQFVIGEDEFVLTVFAPATMPVEHVRDFLNGVWSESLIRSFDPWLGHFVG